MARATEMPTTLTAGETIAVDLTISDYSPNGGYAISFRFGGAAPFTVAGVSALDGAAWALDVTSEATATMGRGRVAWDALATKDGVSTVADSGVISVTASPLTVSRYVATLAAVETAIGNYATSTKRSFSVDGISTTYRDLDELLNLRAFLKHEIAQENGARRSSVILTRFL